MLQLGNGSPCTAVLPSSTFRMACYSRVWYNSSVGKIAMIAENADREVDDHIVELELVANVFACLFADVPLAGCLDLICAIRPLVNSHFNLCSISCELNEKKYSDPTSEEVVTYLKSLEGFIKEMFKGLQTVDKVFAEALWIEFQKAHNLRRLDALGAAVDVVLSEGWADMSAYIDEEIERCGDGANVEGRES